MSNKGACRRAPAPPNLIKSLSYSLPLLHLCCQNLIFFLYKHSLTGLGGGGMGGGEDPSPLFVDKKEYSSLNATSHKIDFVTQVFCH